MHPIFEGLDTNSAFAVENADDVQPDGTVDSDARVGPNVCGTVYVHRGRGVLPPPTPRRVTQPSGQWVDSLLWAVASLERLGVPYQLVGGAAAVLYGVDRPVHDVDFYVPPTHLVTIAAAHPRRVLRPPSHHRDDHWDLTFLALEHAGIRLEIAGADAAYRDGSTGGWHDAAIDFAAATPIRVRGTTVRVMPVGRLCEYKRRLGRPVDCTDVAALEGLAT